MSIVITSLSATDRNSDTFLVESDDFKVRFKCLLGMIADVNGALVSHLNNSKKLLVYMGCPKEGIDKRLLF